MQEMYVPVGAQFSVETKKDNPEIWGKNNKKHEFCEKEFDLESTGR